MKLNGGVNFFENGLTTSIRAMHLQTEVFGIINENYNSFDKVGFQRKEPVVSSFAEYIGIHALSKATDDSIGRIGHSLNPLDIAIANKGYFQYYSPDGIKLTRDGRFKLDKDGNLLTLENYNVLANDGTPIKLPLVPEKLEDVTVDRNGNVRVFNKETKKFEFAGTLSVVTNQGVAVLDPNIKQGFNEYSNVSMHSEILQIIPVKRNFEANRQMFVMQNNNLSKAIQTLSSS